MHDGVSLERNVECVTRDGTVLRADVYHPSDGGRYPTLLNLTPYGNNSPPSLRYSAPGKAILSWQLKLGGPARTRTENQSIMSLIL